MHHSKISTLILTFILTLFASSAFAAGDETFMISAGLEGISQRDVNKDIQLTNFPIISAGFRYSDFWFLFEGAANSQSSGNDSLNVNSSTNLYMLTLHWEIKRFEYVVPYFILSAGEAQLTSTTNLIGAQSSKFSENDALFAAGFGMRSNFDIFFIAGELNVLNTSAFDPNPTMGVTGKVGLYF